MFINENYDLYEDPTRENELVDDIEYLVVARHNGYRAVHLCKTLEEAKTLYNMYNKDEAKVYCIDFFWFSIDQVTLYELGGKIK